LKQIVHFPISPASSALPLAVKPILAAESSQKINQHSSKYPYREQGRDNKRDKTEREQAVRENTAPASAAGRKY